MLRRRKTAKAPRGRRVHYELIAREAGGGAAMYGLLERLVEQHHGEDRETQYDIREARIALAWCTSWKGDVDGRVTLGKCRKASDLDRELAPYDFVILLHRPWWESVLTSEAAREAILDHELTHCARALDAITGAVKRDERGRCQWRLRKHDVEEFAEIVHRHGLYKGDVERLYQAAVVHARHGYEPCATCKDVTPQGGWISDDGGKTLRRCTCWTAWAALVGDKAVAA